MSVECINIFCSYQNNLRPSSRASLGKIRPEIGSASLPQPDDVKYQTGFDANSFHPPSDGSGEDLPPSYEHVMANLSHHGHSMPHTQLTPAGCGDHEILHSPLRLSPFIVNDASNCNAPRCESAPKNKKKPIIITVAPAAQD